MIKISLSVLICGIILVVCIIANKFASKSGVPVLLLFILLGMLAGSEGLLKINFDDYRLAGDLSSFALIFIMFYGGFGTNWRIARPVTLPSLLLSTLGVLLTAGLTGLFCHIVLGFSLLEGLLIGAIVGSTDAASVFSILRNQRLNLKHGLASLLEIESGSNDPTAYMLTVVILSLMKSGGLSFWQIMLAQIGFGLLFGFVMAKISVWILKRVRFENGGLESIFVVAIALVSYGLPAVLGGNGYLSAYITGIVLGNSKIHHKTQLVHFFDGVTWMMQMMLFFVIGLLSFPSQIPQILLPALGIVLCLTFVSRPIAVGLLLTPFKFPIKHQLLVAWAGLRGAASIVFAIMAVVDQAYIGSDIFHIVFCVALFSVGLCGTLLPWLSRKLDLVDDSEPVFKTFTDYDHLSQMPLLEIEMTENHPWAGRRLHELQLPSDLLVIMIKRKKQSVLPKGNTKILPKDVLVLCGATYHTDTESLLSEEELYEGHPWLGEEMEQILSEGKILLIKRDDASIIPNKATLLQKGDIILYRQD